MRLNSGTYLHGESVVLIPYKKTHVEKYHTWMQDEELQRLTASEPLSLEQEYEMQLTWLVDDKKCTFIVLDRECFLKNQVEVEAMIGDTNLFIDDDPAMFAEAEIMIAETNFRGKGKGREAMLLMLRYGVEVIGITKFTAKIGFDNLQSLRMFERLMFSEVFRSEIFHEVTLECVVDKKWINWLNEETPVYELVEEFVK